MTTQISEDWQINLADNANAARRMNGRAWNLPDPYSVQSSR
jgi:hypothetical protein